MIDIPHEREEIGLFSVKRGVTAARHGARLEACRQAWDLTIRGVEAFITGGPKVGSEGSAGTAMLGLPGFVLLAVSQVAGELEQAVETTAARVFCPSCGVLAKPHARRPSRVRDLPSGGRPVTLIWVKRVWRCREPLCKKATWTETAAALRPRAVLTERPGPRRAAGSGRTGCRWPRSPATSASDGTP